MIIAHIHRNNHLHNEWVLLLACEMKKNLPFVNREFLSRKGHSFYLCAVIHRNVIYMSISQCRIFFATRQEHGKSNASSRLQNLPSAKRTYNFSKFFAVDTKIC